MTKKEKIQFIKDFVNDAVNMSVTLPNLMHLDSFNNTRPMYRVYRGIVKNKPTDFYFIETSSSTACLDVATEDAVNILYDFLSK